MESHAELTTPKLVDIELVSSGWINKYELIYKLPDGAEYKYEAASRKQLDKFRAGLAANSDGRSIRPDAVCIVPLLPDNSLLMIREFRYPLNAWCIAFPAGLLDEGETVRECVVRELHEEVGYRIAESWGDDAIIPLSRPGFSSTGFTDESVQVVFARVVEDGEAHPEYGELIAPFKLRFDDIDRFLQESSDVMGTRAQLVLEMVKRGWSERQRRKQPRPQEPLTKHDFA